jgi:NADPH-dependent curcumin reductase CurA
MKEAAPEGIDVYFDNTGGEIFETCLFAMKNFGRIACCARSPSTTARPRRMGPVASRA